MGACSAFLPPFLQLTDYSKPAELLPFCRWKPLVQRIVILGNAGSGKSTLARLLGKHLNSPVVHLDTLFWDPGWAEPDAVQFRERVRDSLATNAWISEGNYPRRTFDLRLPDADLIIWLDTPRLTCLMRVIVRSVMNCPRADLPAGCREKLDRTFLRFLKYVWQFDDSYRPSIEAVRIALGPRVPTVHINGRQQIRDLLDGLSASPEGPANESAMTPSRKNC